MECPITMRLHASITTAQYTFPVPVGCSVMSATQSRSGPSSNDLDLGYPTGAIRVEPTLALHPRMPDRKQRRSRPSVRATGRRGSRG